MSRMKQRAAINGLAVPTAESDVQTEWKLKIISRTNLFAFQNQGHSVRYFNQAAGRISGPRWLP